MRRQDSNDQLINSLRKHEKDSGEKIVEWLNSKNISWKFPEQNISKKYECVSYCKWCRSPIGYIGTEFMVKFYSNYTCTSCTPSPHPEIFIREILPSMSSDLKSKIIEHLILPIGMADKFDILNAILFVIDQAR